VDNWYDNNCDDHYGTLSQLVIVHGPVKNQEAVGPAAGVSPQSVSGSTLPGLHQVQPSLGVLQAN
jgi:hypothetical protein